MTKLYTVTIEYDYVVAVDDDEDPYDVAHEVYRDVKYDTDAGDVCMFVTEMKRLPDNWDEQCFPYRCNAEEKRIGDILKETN